MRLRPLPADLTGPPPRGASRLGQSGIIFAATTLGQMAACQTTDATAFTGHWASAYLLGPLVGGLATACLYWWLRRRRWWPLPESAERRRFVLVGVLSWASFIAAVAGPTALLSILGHYRTEAGDSAILLDDLDTPADGAPAAVAPPPNPDSAGTERP
jgi:hypothetical protein